jgi:hypothetical protein
VFIFPTLRAEIALALKPTVLASLRGGSTLGNSLARAGYLYCDGELDEASL